MRKPGMLLLEASSAFRVGLTAPLQADAALALHRATRRITAREAEVLKLIADGLVNKQIAAQLRLSIKTVEKHRQSVMNKLNIHSIALLTRYAVSNHLVAA